MTDRERCAVGDIVAGIRGMLPIEVRSVGMNGKINKDAKPLDINDPRTLVMEVVSTQISKNRGTYLIAATEQGSGIRDLEADALHATELKKFQKSAKSKDEWENADEFTLNLKGLGRVTMRKENGKSLPTLRNRRMQKSKSKTMNKSGASVLRAVAHELGNYGYDPEPIRMTQTLSYAINDIYGIYLTNDEDILFGRRGGESNEDRHYSTADVSAQQIAESIDKDIQARMGKSKTNKGKAKKSNVKKKDGFEFDVFVVPLNDPDKIVSAYAVRGFNDEGDALEYAKRNKPALKSEATVVFSNAVGDIRYLVYWDGSVDDMRKSKTKKARMKKIEDKTRYQYYVENDFHSQEQFDGVVAGLGSVQWASWVEIDVHGTIDNINSIPILVGCDMPASHEPYFDDRRAFVKDCYEVFKQNGLDWAGDRVEDNDTYFYFVLKSTNAKKSKTKKARMKKGTASPDYNEYSHTFGMGGGGFPADSILGEAYEAYLRTNPSNPEDLGYALSEDDTFIRRNADEYNEDEEGSWDDFCYEIAYELFAALNILKSKAKKGRMKKDYTSDNILSIIRAQPNIAMSWGAKDFRAIPDGLTFHVNGFKHKGDVTVTYNAAWDTWEVTVGDEHIPFIYSDNLVETIDHYVETGGASAEQYKQQVSDWLQDPNNPLNKSSAKAVRARKARMKKEIDDAELFFDEGDRGDDYWYSFGPDDYEVSEVLNYSGIPVEVRRYPIRTGNGEIGGPHTATQYVIMLPDGREVTYADTIAIEERLPQLVNDWAFNKSAVKKRRMKKDAIFTSFPSKNFPDELRAITALGHTFQFVENELGHFWSQEENMGDGLTLTLRLRTWGEDGDMRVIVDKDGEAITDAKVGIDVNASSIVQAIGEKWNEAMQDIGKSHAKANLRKHRSRGKMTKRRSYDADAFIVEFEGAGEIAEFQVEELFESINAELEYMGEDFVYNIDETMNMIREIPIGETRDIHGYSVKMIRKSKVRKDKGRIKKMVAIAGGWVNDEVTVELEGCTEVKFAPPTTFPALNKAYEARFKYFTRDIRGNVIIKAEGELDLDAPFIVKFWETDGTTGIAIDAGILPISNESFKKAAIKGWNEFVEKDKNVVRLDEKGNEIANKNASVRKTVPYNPAINTFHAYNLCAKAQMDSRRLGLTKKAMFDIIKIDPEKMLKDYENKIRVVHASDGDVYIFDTMGVQ